MKQQVWSKERGAKLLREVENKTKNREGNHMAMDKVMEPEKFESWAIVELYGRTRIGRTRIAGKVSEQTIDGCSFVRVDVPECNGQKPYSKLFGLAAIYAMTPCSGEVARAALKQIIWMSELWRPALKPTTFGEDEVCRLCGDPDCNGDCEERF